MDGKHREIIDRLRQCEKDLAQLDAAGQSSTALVEIRAAIKDLEDTDDGPGPFMRDFIPR